MLFPKIPFPHDFTEVILHEIRGEAARFAGFSVSSYFIMLPYKEI